MRSLHTLKEWGEKLKRQHRPADFLALPDFMMPKVMAPARQVVTAEVVAASAEDRAPEPVRRLICTQCGVKISYAEGKFCWNNTKRFNGQQYCREHQGVVG